MYHVTTRPALSHRCGSVNVVAVISLSPVLPSHFLERSTFLSRNKPFLIHTRFSHKFCYLLSKWIPLHPHEMSVYVCVQERGGGGECVNCLIVNCGYGSGLELSWFPLSVPLVEMTSGSAAAAN